MEMKKYVYIVLGVIALAIAGWVFYPAIVDSPRETGSQAVGARSPQPSMADKTPAAKASFSTASTTIGTDMEETPPPSGIMLRVSVMGNVTYPGIYMADRGETVADLIERAGGLVPGADTSKLDMDKQVYDGEYIGVP